MLLYTHVDDSHDEASYRASGWQRIGETLVWRCAASEPISEQKPCFLISLPETASCVVR